MRVGNENVYNCNTCTTILLNIGSEGKWRLCVSMCVIKYGCNWIVITYGESGTYETMHNLFDNKILCNKTEPLNF